MTENNIPPAKNIRVTDIGSHSINLKWDKAESELPIVYKVFVKRRGVNEEWKKCYEDTETKCECSNLNDQTLYEFKISSFHNGKNLGWVSCNASTALALWKVILALTVGLVTGIIIFFGLSYIISCFFDKDSYRYDIKVKPNITKVAVAVGICGGITAAFKFRNNFFK